jgi:hypothetical protein
LQHTIMLLAVSHTNLLCVASCMFVEYCKILGVVCNWLTFPTDVGNEMSLMVQKVSIYQYVFFFSSLSVQKTLSCYVETDVTYSSTGNISTSAVEASAQWSVVIETDRQLPN